jgi:hypothetical protein
MVKGNPALYDWLLMAMAITVWDFRLNKPWVRI